jgi:hypothetical protein
LGVRGRLWRQLGHQVHDRHPGRLPRSGLLGSERAWVIQDRLQVLLPGDEHPVGDPALAVGQRSAWFASRLRRGIYGST